MSTYAHTHAHVNGHFTDAPGLASLKYHFITKSDKTL